MQVLIKIIVMHFFNVKLNLSSTKVVVLPCEELREEIVSKLTSWGEKKKKIRKSTNVYNCPMNQDDFKCFYRLLSMFLTKVNNTLIKKVSFSVLGTYILHILYLHYFMVTFPN